MSREPDRSNGFGVDLPSWTDFEAASEALHLRSFGRLLKGGLLASVSVAGGGDGWVPDLDGLVQLTSGGHVARGSDERIVGLRLRPRADVAANGEDEDAIPDGSMFGEALPVSSGRIGGFASDVRCWDDLAALRVVGVGELIANEVYVRLARHGGRADRVRVREAVVDAVEVVWASAWPVDLRNSVSRLAQLRRVALPARGLCEGSAAGVLTWESSGWPGATGILPTGQLNLGVDVAYDGVISGRGLPWPAALIPFSDHDPPLVIADGARAIERAMTPARPEPPRVSGGLVGSPIIGADVLVALVPLDFSDPAVIVSSDLIDSARLSCVDESGQVRALGLGDVLVDRHGSGGVVAEIRASRELPRLADGKPVDILVDPVHVVRWGRFGTLSEVEAFTRDVYDPVRGQPIDALAGILHVMRQARPVEPRTDVAAIDRATLASVEWADNTPAIVVHAVVPDPELSSDMCCLPRSLWHGDSPSAALLVGSRPCAIRGYRVVPVDGDVARVPATARSLFVTPWSGEPVTVAVTTEKHAEVFHSPTVPAIERTVVTMQRVTVAALQPFAVKSVFSSVPEILLEIAQQFERGIITDEERTEHSAVKLTLIFQEIEQTLREEAARAPESVLATLSRGGVGMWRLAPLLVDREGRAGGPWLADYLGGISAEVMCAAVAPSGVPFDWPARALILTKRLIELCSDLHVTETDCGRPPLREPRVRSPLECRTTRGVCATCVGAPLDKTSVPSVGTPVGLLGALALSRELPNIWLHTFHVCGTHLPAQHGLLRFEELIDGTQPPTAAILAERDGVVRVADDRLTLLDASGTEVQTIAQNRGRPLLAVNDGERIETGAPLTVGPLPLGDLARLRGSAAVDRYVVGDMVSLLEGRDVAASLIECVVRAIRITWPWDADRR
jgi:hypothetical protein